MDVNTQCYEEICTFNPLVNYLFYAWPYSLLDATSYDKIHVIIITAIIIIIPITHRLIFFTACRRQNAFFAAKNLKVHQRRPVNNYLTKYLRKHFLLECTTSDYICGKCSRPAYPFQQPVSLTVQARQQLTRAENVKLASNQTQNPPSVWLNIKSATKSHAYCFICKKKARSQVDCGSCKS